MSEEGRRAALDRWAGNWEIDQQIAPLQAAYEEACQLHGEDSNDARKLRERIAALERRRP